MVGPCEPAALTAGLDRVGRLGSLQSLEVNAARWAAQQRPVTASGVPRPGFGRAQSTAVNAATSPRRGTTSSPGGQPVTGAAGPHHQGAAGPHRQGATTHPGEELPSTSLLVPATVVEAVRDEAAAELLWADRHRPVRYPVGMLPVAGRLRCLVLHIGTNM